MEKTDDVDTLLREEWREAVEIRDADLTVLAFALLTYVEMFASHLGEYTKAHRAFPDPKTLAPEHRELLALALIGVETCFLGAYVSLDAPACAPREAILCRIFGCKSTQQMRDTLDAVWSTVFASPNSVPGTLQEATGIMRALVKKKIQAAATAAVSVKVHV